ncbi:hypothetical protein KC19_2G188700 [Ceratodon purpureus]|uniref:C2 domain-containing protein n=1 Tax=Ceratodon purpureus TaxID=3225 RepID=A0A8T0IXX2_CERPU|nr:hypothetical protein KC19_2G188700 [Ceratodon purpureus]
MEGSNLTKIGESSPTGSQDGTPRFQEVTQAGSFRVGVGAKLEHRRNKVHKLSHSGGSNGRLFDLEDIASGSNGSHVTSTDRACRVTVTIIAAKDLKRTATGPDARDPVFKVRVEQVLRKSKDIKIGSNQDGILNVNQSFTFDVRDLKSAQITLQVVARGVLGIEEALGHINNLCVLNLLEEQAGRKDVETKWYDLYSKSGNRLMPGKLYMQVIVGMAEPEQTISAFVGTWNVGNARPPADLSPWLPTDAFFEIIAIGTQECDYPPRAPYTECSKDWTATLKSHFGERYKLVHATSRGQMRLVVFVRDDAEKAISEVDNDSEATGVGNVMANKGGVCIAFKFWDTGLCFVNCHFAAHVGQCETRNSNFRQIAMSMRVGLQSMDLLSQFHHVFWLGDLNYRLDFGKLEPQGTTPDRAFWATIVKQIHANRWKELLKYDELRKEKGASRILAGFKEGEITFPPTFKMQRDFLDHYDQKRMPAWCDRVLWKTLQGCHSYLISYFSAPSILTSDHKPVGATYKLTSYALPSSTMLPPGGTDEDDKRWHIRFTSLRAKKLRASDINGFSDPFVSFIGPNLLQEFHSKVKHQTLNPVWNPLQELPTLVLSSFPLQRVDKEYLMVRVLDHDSDEDALGYGVIPLGQAVAAFKKGVQEIAHFKVNLSHHGLPAGTLEGGMKLTWEKNVIKRKGYGADLSSRGTSIRDSLKKKIFVRNRSPK